MRVFTELVLLPLFINADSQLIAEWLIRKLVSKRKTQQ